MSERAPFVSGLPGPFVSPPAEATRRGIEKMERMRALALDMIDELNPQTRNYFDGVVRYEANEVAIEQTRTYTDIVRLLDLIANDDGIKASLAKGLSAGAGQ